MNETEARPGCGVAQGIGENYKVEVVVRDFEGDVNEYRARYGDALGERLFLEGREPVREQVAHGNLITTNGANLIWTAMTGGAITAFNNSNSRICVGNGTTAAAVGQTDLQGGSKQRLAMDATYPQVSTNTVVFRSTAGTGDANFDWQEWGLANNATTGTLLNRKVENLGTKTNAVTRQITVTLSA